MDKESVVRICIDDFALKRRYRYGTIMVNIDTGRIVDIFESRQAEDIARWLAAYPNIAVVSRDGSPEYAKAISVAHPGAIQVSDRFHLVKNLAECAAQHIRKVVGANFRISAGSRQSDADGGYWDLPERYGPDLLERQHIASTEKKSAVISMVRELAEQGLNVNRIAKETGLSWNTTKIYLDDAFDPADVRYGVNCASKLDPYAETIDSMLRQHSTFREIEEKIRLLGYKGAASTIRMYATRQRRRMRAAADNAIANTELIERKWLTKLLYLPIEKVKGITEGQLGRIIHEYPVIGRLFDAQRTFKEIVFSKRVDELDAWLESASLLEIDELSGFCNGIKRDIEAVKNAIRYEYNNGLAEGKINKIKVIKRIMYGRCSFSLLRNKILLRELT